jgi:hypothetical protein
MEVQATPTNYSKRLYNEDLAPVKERTWTGYRLCDGVKGGARPEGRARQKEDKDRESSKFAHRGSEALRGNTRRLRDGLSAAGRLKQVEGRHATRRKPGTLGERKEG